MSVYNQEFLYLSRLIFNERNEKSSKTRPISQIKERRKYGINSSKQKIKGVKGTGVNWTVINLRESYPINYKKRLNLVYYKTKENKVSFR